MTELGLGIRIVTFSRLNSENLGNDRRHRGTVSAPLDAGNDSVKRLMYVYRSMPL